MSLSLVLFYIIGALSVLSALFVVTTRNIVYAALALLVTLMTVAGIYLLAFAQFLLLVQVLIYGGAIIIVVMFAIMLTRMADYQTKASVKQWPLAAVAGAAIFGVLAAALLMGAPAKANVVTSVGFQDLGTSLFTEWAVPFEIASLVLLVALIGAIVLARENGGKE